MSHETSETAGAAPPAGATAAGEEELAPRLERAFTLDPGEGAEPVAGVRGEVPAFLRGTWYVNGPARFGRGDVAYRHWLDGDGMVAAVTFGREGISFARRFVRGAKLTEEDAAGACLYRTFGTRFEGDRLLKGIGLASPLNVSVYPWDGRLLSFGEQGLPWELDPVTLETRGEHGFGRLSPITPFSAHPAFDTERGEMVNFGVSFSARRPTLNLFTIRPGEGNVERRRIPLDQPYSVHDFGLTRRWAVFHLGPYLLDMAALLEGATVQESLSWQPERGTRLLLVDRTDPAAPPVEVPLGQGYCLHHAHAWERDDGRLVVDFLELVEPVYPDYEPIPDLFVEVEPSRPVRLLVDPRAEREEDRLLERREIDFPWAADFPAVDPRTWMTESDVFYALAISHTGRPGRKFFDRLVRFDWRHGGVADVWEAPPCCYLGGEPIFLPDPARPGEGVVVCERLDVGASDEDPCRTDLLLFDAADLGRGPVAEIELPAPLSPGFHASWHAG